MEQVSLHDKIEQIAFGCWNLYEWEYQAQKCSVTDRVVFDGRFRRNSSEPWIEIKDKVGYLAFDYLTGLEREYLHYPNRKDTFHELIPFNFSELYLSHFGQHCDDIQGYIEQHGETNLIMDVRTKSHTNAYLIDKKRTYRYVIFDKRAESGYFWKLIQRFES